MKKNLLLFFIVFRIIEISAQNSTVVRGIVYDSITGTPLPYTAVFFKHTTIGTMSDNGGRFLLKIKHDTDSLRKIGFSLPGYKMIYTTTTAQKSSWLEIYLQPASMVDDVSVLGGKWKDKPLFKNLTQAVKIIIDDYVPIGNPTTNKFDFGRIQTLASYNHIEGVRLRAGAASTTRLHPHFFVRGYGAYGFCDKKIKYHVEAAWSFNRRAYHENEFPKHNLRFIKEFDVYSAGESDLNHRNDELLYSFRKAKGTLLYRHLTEINYEKEYLSGLSYMTWTRTAKQTPASAFFFQKMNGDNHLQVVDELNTSEIGITLRYSQREAFIQNRRKKSLLTRNNTVFLLSHSIGLNNIFGGEYRYHKTGFLLQKRFLLGAFGYIDGIFEAQRAWNAVPFPLLLFANVNQSYVIENASFSLLNAMEFINDEQYTLKTTYIADNLMLAHIPFVKKLGLHEVFAVRGLYGRLNNKNIPSPENELFVFPENSETMRNFPYCEGSIGIANILGAFRIDYVQRLSYRNKPGTANYGFRIGAVL